MNGAENRKTASQIKRQTQAVKREGIRHVLPTKDIVTRLIMRKTVCFQKVRYVHNNAGLPTNGPLQAVQAETPLSAKGEALWRTGL